MLRQGSVDPDIEHVHLGDQDTQTAAADLTQEPAVEAEFETLAVQPYVGLQPHGVDRGTAPRQPVEQAQQGVAPRLMVRRVHLQLRFVVSENDLGIGCPCSAERVGDVVGPEFGEEGGAAQTFAGASLGVDRLVDDVPAEHLAGIAARHHGDMRRCERLRRFAGLGGGEVGRQRLVPQQMCARQHHRMLTRKRDVRILPARTSHARLRRHAVPAHVWREQPAMACKLGGVGRRCGCDLDIAGAAEPQPVRLCQLCQSARFGMQRAQARRKARENEGRPTRDDQNAFPLWMKRRTGVSRRILRSSSSDHVWT